MYRWEKFCDLKLCFVKFDSEAKKSSKVFWKVFQSLGRSGFEAETASFLLPRLASLWRQPLAHQLSRQLGWASLGNFSPLSQNCYKTLFPGIKLKIEVEAVFVWEWLAVKVGFNEGSNSKVMARNIRTLDILSISQRSRKNASEEKHGVFFQRSVLCINTEKMLLLMGFCRWI